MRTGTLSIAPTTATVIRRWRERGLTLRVGGFAAALVVLIAMIGVALVIAVRSQRHASSWAVHSVKVLEASQLAERQLVDLETGMRGYAATADRRFLQPTTAALRTLPGQLAVLGRLVSGDPAQSRRVRGLVGAARIEERYTMGLIDHVPLVRGRALDAYLLRGKRIVDGLRAQFTAFNAVESNLALERQRSSNATNTTLWWLAVGAIAAIVVLLAAFVGFVVRDVVVPLRRSIDALGGLQRGERDLRLQDDLPGEIGALASAFNTMVAQLDARERELHELADRHQAVLRTAHNGYISLDRNGTVIAWNEAAERIFGWRSSDALGRRLSQLIIPERYRDAHEAGLARVVGTGRSRALQRRLELVALHQEGREFPVEMTLSSTEVAGDPVFHAFVADLTERHAVERDRRLLAAIAESTPDAIIVVDSDANVVFFNEGAEELYGHRADDLLGRPVVEMNPPGPARELATELVGRMLDGESYTVERVQRTRKDGSQVFVDFAATPLRNTAGEVIGGASILRDVTGQRELEFRLRERERQLADAEGLARLGSWEWDLCEPAMRWNEHLCEIFGVAVGCTSTFEDFIELVHPEERARIRERFQALRAGAETAEGEDRIIRADGEVRYVNARSHARVDEHGRVTHLSGIVQDITERKNHEQQLEQLAGTDSLTGLPNRRVFEERLHDEVARARRHGRPLSLLLLDIDHFKRVNDNHGHPIGDQVLHEVGMRLGGMVRDGELLARIGGEEFGWVLPDADAAGAFAAAERARRAIGTEPFPIVGTLTLSVGVCEIADSSIRDGLTQCADQALYWAKQQGRNRVFRYTQEAARQLAGE
jgi:diguanylate cyclase (GGDEF)-like protein/PAS domain S-box-containing protein